MSRASTSLDLSEFFNNDDSQGHRLVEFLQKRRGAVQQRKYLYMNCEPQRLSLNVQLEKLSNSQEEASKSSQKLAKNNNETVVESSVEPHDAISYTNAKCISEAPVSSISKAPISPISEVPVSPVLNDANSVPFNPFPSLNHRPLSTRFSSIRNCGIVSPSDRLRRYSLKRLTKVCGGRRTLLQEFENTIGDADFEPPVCSTPLSQPQNDNAIPTENSNKPLEAETFEQNLPVVNPIINDTRSGQIDELIGTLQRNNKELKTYIENISELTLKQVQSQEKEKKADETKYDSTLRAKASLKRTYTMEKGNSHGQVILTPEKIVSEKSSSRSFNILRTQEQILIPQNRVSPRGSKMLEVVCSPRRQQRENLSQSLQNSGTHISNTPPQRNVSILLSSQNVDIPEFQNQPDVMTSSITVQSGNPPVVVIPINQTCGKGTDNIMKKNQNDRVDINSNTLSEKLTHQTAKTNDEQCYQLCEDDNLKLTDILTDDEDDVCKTTSSRKANNSTQSPINLAANSINLRYMRFRKRTHLRSLEKNDSQLQSVVADTEPPPRAESNKRLTKRKHIPLNKPPGIPLNGEKFAEELARMSNYEILDLRKRISLGQVFVNLTSKTRPSQEKAAQEIEKELLRRNMSLSNKEQILQSNLDGKNYINEYHPVPDEFRDSFVKVQSPNDCSEAHLLDEISSDRVSFKSKETNRQLVNVNKKRMPQVLQQYLEVSKKFSRKKRISTSNRSKRSLYTKGYSNTEEISDLEETRSRSRISKSIINYVPSPPKSDNNIYAIPNIAPPPPPLSTTLLQSTNQHLQIVRNEIDENSNKNTARNEIDDNSNNTTANIVNVSPPPGFESDTVVNSNNFNNDFTIRSTLQTAKTNSNSTNLTIDHNADNLDQHIFKKPEHSAPKTRGRKRKVDKIASTDMHQTTSDSQQSCDNSTNTTGGALRRSKRGHVPAHNPLFQLLFQQSINKRMQYLEKKKQKIVKNKEKLPVLSENSIFINRLDQDSEILKRNKGTKIRETNVVNKHKKTHKKAKLNTPPSVDHINNVFDELRNTSCTPNMTSQTATSAPPLKTKSVKVRVARLKHLPQPSDLNYVSTTSSTSHSSNYELISWLKNIKESDCSISSNDEIFKEMRISAASSLSFTELQGVEYAFYDTDEKASLGYLRFRPHQVKPKKKAKRFHLHFVALVGYFRITANENDRRIGVGDMVAIEKSVYYDIENLSEDIGILMVIKK